MWVSRTAHFYYEILTFIAAWGAGITCIYLVNTRTPRYLKGYSRMIVWNTALDLFFSFVSVILMGTSEVRSGKFYAIIDQPYHPVDKSLGSFTMAFWTFAMYLTVVAVPIQFIYRYGIICRSVPYSRGQMMMIIGAFTAYVGAHSFLCAATMSPRSVEFDSILDDNPIYHKNLPSAYLAGDTTKFSLYSLHLLNCQVILFVAYGLTIVFGLKTFNKIRNNSSQFSGDRAIMQEEISQMMVLQAIYPVVFMVIPLFLLCAVPFMNNDEIPWLGMVCVGLVNLIPIVNPLSVMLVIPQYRSGLCGSSK